MKNKLSSPSTKPPHLRTLALGAVVLSFSILMSGCASVGVKPWQRDIMAKRDMKPVTHPLIEGMDEHIFFSKEASAGGKSANGGGCGCN